jgi:hypothetical protein
MDAFPRLSSLFVILFSITIPTTVFATCTAPTSPGVRICSPTANATVAYVTALDFNSTPAFGAEILKFSIYDNNRKVIDGLPGQTGETVIDGSIKNGPHTVVINAWDSSGKLYQSRVSFLVTGDGFPFPCPVPSSPGVNFCQPPSNAVLSTHYFLAAAARGKSSIAAMRTYVDGKAQDTQTNVNQFQSGASVGTQGDHRISVVAWDNSGDVYKSTRILHSVFTYGLSDCPPSKGTPQPCTPGFDTNSMPAPNTYVGNSFTMMASIVNNPNPITTMKAYIDNTVFAVSNGPTMASPVTGAPNGTHILTLQAWDTKGIVYRVQYNININVPH